MSVIVRDDGFHAEDSPGPVVDIPPDTAPETLAGLLQGAAVAAVLFPAFSDGRGFTLARLIRAHGFAGRLRARGPLIADQYPLLRRAGFDEVEIPQALAARQPQAQWLARTPEPPRSDYRSRLRAAV